MRLYDVIVVGGGLAGLTAAIDLSQKGQQVLVFEKQEYPHHKVCGEYVSNEVVPYLNRLGISLEAVNAVAIDTLKLSTANGRYIETGLPLGGKGISRYAFDNLLYRLATDNGVAFQFHTVSSIKYKSSIFEVVTNQNKTYTSTVVIGAYGKRSSLDKALNRDYVNQKSPWLAVKAHYRYDNFPDSSVALHNFEGGYAGLSKTETGAVNFCYLASYTSFQKKEDINSFNADVVAKNPFLGEFLQKAKPLFEKPLTIAQISFHPKKAVEDHILMCGDTAGLIHPLCGNGMAMAIHSAKIASELVDDFLKRDTIKWQDIRHREELEASYQKQWDARFKRRLWMGRRLQSILLNPKLSNIAFSLIVKQPRMLQKLISQTHGEAIA